MIIGIDTSTALTSIALLADGQVVDERSSWDPRRHAEVVGPMLEAVLGDVDRSMITRVVCGVGPGPYTGLRVGVCVARALGFAWGIPVVGVCSLDAIAAAAHERMGSVVVATDARRAEVYWARYDLTGVRTDGPRVGPAAEVPWRDEWVGHGARLHGRLAAGMGDLPVDSALMSPSAAWIARLGAQGEPTGVVDALSVHGGDGGSTVEAIRGSVVLAPQPLYLRRPDAVEPGAR